MRCMQRRVNLASRTARLSFSLAGVRLTPCLRLLRCQVGHKGMRYVQLHAEAVLDLVERAPREVQFRAVSGDFQMLQGKFMLSQPFEVRPGPGALLSMLGNKGCNMMAGREVRLSDAGAMSIHALELATHLRSVLHLHDLVLLW